jgi:hypothetical protein
VKFPSLKLDENNYLLWLSQVVPTLKSHELPQSMVDDANQEVLNPSYKIWIKKNKE